MKKKILIALLVVFVICLASVGMFSYSNTETGSGALYTEVEQTYTELLAKNYLDLTSDWYVVSDNYISKIYPNTKISEFKKKINLDLKVYDGENEVTTGIIKSGMHVTVNDEKYILIVIGDVNGDGLFNQIDLSGILINYSKAELNMYEKLASDVNEDGKFTTADYSYAAKCILDNKIIYKDVVKVEKPALEVVGTKKENGWYQNTVTLRFVNKDSSDVTLKYKIEGTYPQELTEIASGQSVTLRKYGAYKVYLWAYASDNNRSLVDTKVIGLDTDNMCVKYGIDKLSECMLVNDGEYKTVSAAVSGIAAKGSINFSTAESRDYGLTAAADDYGTSYIYRGGVYDNYVDFAGYSWRIVRRNGDGSIRLIYNGKSSSYGDDLFIGKSAYNTESQDFSFIGYKYSLEPTFVVANNTVEYNVIETNTVYYFADKLDCSDETGKCKLGGNKISGVWSQVYDQVLSGYKYTCWATTEDAECRIASEVTSAVYSGTNIVTTKANVKYHAYLTVSDAMRNNETDSTVKTVVDKWYEDNLLNAKDQNGVNYTDYIVDQTFCNDRKIYTGEGKDLLANTLYEPYKRMSWKTSSLKCNNVKDRFSVTTEKGNGDLKYPIGLITVDEISYAGGTTSTTNVGFWLHDDQNYWTMSPSGMNVLSPYVNVWYYSWNGKPMVSTTSNAMGIRPVINLSADVIVTGGNGTASNPYQVMLNK